MALDSGAAVGCVQSGSHGSQPRHGGWRAARLSTRWAARDRREGSRGGVKKVLSPLRAQRAPRGGSGRLLDGTGPAPSHRRPDDRSDHSDHAAARGRSADAEDRLGSMPRWPGIGGRVTPRQPPWLRRLVAGENRRQPSAAQPCGRGVNTGWPPRRATRGRGMVASAGSSNDLEGQDVAQGLAHADRLATEVTQATDGPGHPSQHGRGVTAPSWGCSSRRPVASPRPCGRRDPARAAAELTVLTLLPSCPPARGRDRDGGRHQPGRCRTTTHREASVAAPPPPTAL